MFLRAERILVNGSLDRSHDTGSEVLETLSSIVHHRTVNGKCELALNFGR